MVTGNPNTPMLITSGFAGRLNAMLRDYEKRRPGLLNPHRHLRRRRPSSGSEVFFATITDSEIESGTSEYIYTWTELQGSRNGTEAHDTYSGLLSLVGETVLMILGGDGTYRFCWDRPWRGEVNACGADWADIEDPHDAANLIRVDRTAGFYEPTEIVLMGPMGESEAYAWTIIDRIPMTMYVPLSGAPTGDSSNDMAPVQDEPNEAGCDA
jgi:hypothetical protein